MDPLSKARNRLFGPSLLEVWQPILPRLRLKSKRGLPNWPPDLFALTAVALKRDSLYAQVLSSDWPHIVPNEATPTGWAEFCHRTAWDWIQAWQSERRAPKFVSERWSLLVNRIEQPYQVETGGADKDLGRVLLELLSISDEACQYLVTHYGRRDEAETSVMALIWTRKFLERNQQSSICDEIEPWRLRVLPKHRTPQKGLTIRSLSLYVGLLDGNEIRPQHETPPFRKGGPLNVLVLPWPLELRPSNFRVSTPLPGEMQNMSDDFGFFTFVSAGEPGSVVKVVLALLNQAEQDVGQIDIVVLPELALSEESADELAKALEHRDIGLIAGVGKPANPANGHGLNSAVVKNPDQLPIWQRKQHRWKLDHRQVRQYSLGGILDPSRSWWEHIDISSRQVTFTGLKPWLNTCVLICEDLARPDPAADAIRAVGPNLTIALLMDGPQIRTRWGATHAKTLVEDPGCSVLTITSLGMAKMSRADAGQSDRSRVIALWRDEDRDVEIELPPGRDAAVLSLSVKNCLDWSADGRSRTSGVPTLSGVRFLQVPTRIGKMAVSSSQVENV